MGYADKDHLHIPFPAWAKDGEVRDDRDFENWKELQRWADRLTLSGGGGGPAIIDLGDSLVYTGFTKTYYPLRAATLVSARGTLSVAGESDTLTQLYHNDDMIGTLTIPAGAVVSDPLDLNVSFGEDDYWQALVTQAGTGAAGLTVYGDFT